MQRNTHSADGFLEQLVLHQIKADKFFNCHKRDGRAFANIGQLEETGRRRWARKRRMDMCSMIAEVRQRQPQANLKNGGIGAC